MSGTKTSDSMPCEMHERMRRERMRVWLWRACSRAGPSCRCLARAKPRGPAEVLGLDGFDDHVEQAFAPALAPPKRWGDTAEAAGNLAPKDTRGHTGTTK